MAKHLKQFSKAWSAISLHLRLLGIALLLTACSVVTDHKNNIQDKVMYHADDFAKLQFLQGRWEGKGPDGKLFYEEYRFESAVLFRSTRYQDDTFSASNTASKNTPADGSTVEFSDGQIIAKWLEFSWQASDIRPGKACFVPLNAPSSFCWEQINSNTVHVTQSWQGEDGTPQQFVMPLRRL